MESTTWKKIREVDIHLTLGNVFEYRKQNYTRKTWVHVVSKNKVKNKPSKIGIKKYYIFFFVSVEEKRNTILVV